LAFTFHARLLRKRHFDVVKSRFALNEEWSSAGKPPPLVVLW
jgi:hypothetical protein